MTGLFPRPARLPCLDAWRLRILVVGMVVMLTAACAAKQIDQPDEDTLPLPEVTGINLRGHETFSAAQLRKAMTTKGRPFFPPWKRGGDYNKPTLEADLRRLKKFYFDRGFLETNVRLHQVEEDPDNQTVAVEIVIEEGKPTRIRQVDIVGTIPPELRSARALLDELPLQVGKRISKAAFDQSRAFLLKQLQDAGYARAKVRPRTEVDTVQHLAAVTFTLQPGKKTFFGDITITGMKQVREKAIRSQLKMGPGDLYSDLDLTDTTEAIYKLGMFQTVTPQALNLDEADTPLNVEYNVRERKPRNIRVGVGASTFEGFRLLADWTHRNLFGGAERLELTSRVATFSQIFEADLRVPYIRLRRTSATYSLFTRNQSELKFPPFDLVRAMLQVVDPQPGFDALQVGNKVTLEHEIIRRLTLFGGVELSWNTFRNVDREALTDDELEAATDNILLAQFVGVKWNTRDDRLDPTRGVFILSRAEHANSAFLSDVSYVKLEVEGRHYLGLRRGMILATRLQVGGIQPYGDTNEVPFNVRFFAGGPGSVRGFKLNRLGPLDENGNPIGGQSLIEGSVEIRFPIAGPIGGVVFVDAGNVFREPFTYRLDDLRYATGTGLRYLTPIGPLRIDVGIILDPEPGEGFGRVEFSIGQAF